jgi:glycosyltransferase involved in cell wall biosynthesis
MTPLPSVSVIIPTYNRENLLGNAIDSVLNQTFHDFELIIVDDGSIDDTCAIVKNYQDDRIKLICHPSNLGLAAAWNSGIRLSQSGLVAFLDSDDNWHPNKLAEQVSLINENPDIDGCTVGYVLNGLHGIERVIPTKKDLKESRILFHNTLHLGTTLMVRRSVFNQIGFFEETLKRGQDTDWLVRFIRTKGFQVVPELLATVNQHTQRSAAVLEQARIEMLHKNLNSYQRFGNFFTHRKIAKMWSDVAYQYERENNREKMREFAYKSIKSFPIQSPGIYLILIDSLIGSHLKKTLGNLRKILSSYHRRNNSNAKSS